jgi:hypothetical protein
MVSLWRPCVARTLGYGPLDWNGLVWIAARQRQLQRCAGNTVVYCAVGSCSLCVCMCSVVRCFLFFFPFVFHFPETQNSCVPDSAHTRSPKIRRRKVWTKMVDVLEFQNRMTADRKFESARVGGCALDNILGDACCFQCNDWFSQCCSAGGGRRPERLEGNAIIGRLGRSSALSPLFPSTSLLFLEGIWGGGLA